MDDGTGVAGVTVVPAVLAYLTAVLHGAFVCYLAVGGLLAWRWPRTIGLHVAAVAWGALAVAVALPCPLTGLENELRQAAGWQPLDSGFIDAYVEGVLVPEQWSWLVRWAMAALVLVGWGGVHLRRRPARPTAPSGPATVRPGTGVSAGRGDGSGGCG